MDIQRADRERRHALILEEPRPLEHVSDIWAPAAQMATVGIFLLLLITCLYFSGAIVLPVLAGLVIAMTLAPVVKFAQRVIGMPPWVTSLLLMIVLLGVASVLVTLVAGPMSEWISRAPEIGENIRQKLYVFDRPIAALRDLQKVLSPNTSTVSVETSQISMVTPVLAFVTPAVAETVLFLATLFFFLAGQMEFRRFFASLFESREAKLRFLRIANDVERNLAGYLATVTVIYVGLGIVVATGAWLFGFPSPVLLGVLAASLNYIPYVGPACMAMIMFAVGLVSFPSLGPALAGASAIVALSTLEGHFITPMILGRHLTLNPLTILLVLAFWTWLWGPMGAFLALPISIVGMVMVEHLFPSDDPKLPG